MGATVPQPLIRPDLPFYRYRLHTGAAGVAERVDGVSRHLCAVGQNCVGDPWQRAQEIVDALNAAAGCFGGPPPRKRR